MTEVSNQLSTTRGQCVCASCSVMSDFVIPWTIAHQPPLFMEFSRQEYWIHCDFLCQGIFLTQGSNPGLHIATRFFTSLASRKTHQQQQFKYAAAAAAKSLQSCPTLCDSIDGSPPGSPIPGILQARTLEWVAISFSNAGKCKVKVKSLSHVQLLATPWTAAHEAPASLGFSRQEYKSGLPLPSPSLNISWLKTQHSEN